MEMTRPDQSDPAIPRFGIFHLTTLTTGVAIYLGWTELYKSFQPAETRLENQNLTLILNLLFAPPIGIILAGLIWLAQVKRRTGRFCWRPGHWILACFGINYVLDWLFELILVATFAIAGQPDSETYGICFLGAYAVSTMLTVPLLIAAAIAVERRSWKSFFSLLAASHAIAAAKHLAFAVAQGYYRLTFSMITAFEWATLTVSAGVVVAFVVALIRDRTAGTQNDWIHWSGVVVFLLYWIVAPIGQMIAFRYLPPFAS